MSLPRRVVAPLLLALVASAGCTPSEPGVWAGPLAARGRVWERFETVGHVWADYANPFDPDEIISLNPAITELRELKSELCQVTYKYNDAGKVVINKAPDGHPSPNRADCIVIGCAPLAVQNAPSVTTL